MANKRNSSATWGADSSKRLLGRAPIIVDHGVSFDLQQPVGVNESRYLHDRVDGTNVSKELAVHRRHRLPVVNAGEQDPGPHDVAKRGPSAFKSGGDDFEAAPGLRSRVPPPDGATIGPERRGAGNSDDRSRPNRP